MRKIIFYFLFFAFIHIRILAESVSVITNNNYFNNPRAYLSMLDTSKINSKILIDRVIYDDLILNTNGSDKVSTISADNWNQMYNELKWANNDTLYLYDLDSIYKTVDLFYQSNKSYPVGIIDFSFKRIKQSAIDNNELIQNPEYLYDNSATSNSFSNHRVLAVSSLSNNVYGDEVTFIFNDYFHISNNTNQILKSIQVDFGNGQGFRDVARNEAVHVVYNSNSEYVEMIVKLEFENINTFETEILYSHSSFFRTGSSTVPMPDQVLLNSLPDLGGNIAFAPILDPDKRILYPIPTYTNINIGCQPFALLGADCSQTIDVPMGAMIEAHFLFSTRNSSGKLRKPFILCDGFDPNNERNYFESNTGDKRGLFQILNGDPSPWYKDSPEGNLIELLRNDGYDIVFVNFIDGAGDVKINANAFRGFINDVINSEALRDNNTEEAVLVGPSMGGLITRLALTAMEQANPKEEHFVKTWISFDSPHKGAYIPLGLQHAVDFLTNIHVFGGDLESGRNSFIANKKKLNTTAAKQMLLYHHTNTHGVGDHTSLFDELYNQLDVSGFPVYSTNVAISNGGKTKLYEENGAGILDFEIAFKCSDIDLMFNHTWVHAWGNRNKDGKYTILDGSRQGANNDVHLQTNNQIAYDNAPGGWNDALYSFNYHSNNRKKPDSEKPRLMKATFMPTPTTFAIPITRENVFTTWESYTGCSDNESGKIKTPFDSVHGMQDNEEHVRISSETVDYLINDVLNPASVNIQRPVVRANQQIDQSISGKLAYVAENKITLGGNGNQITFQSGSDVIAKAGESITILPGFIANTGSNFKASIENSNNNMMHSKANITDLKSVDYSQRSPFIGKKYDYSNKKESFIEISEPFELHVSPNPVQKLIKVKLVGLEEEDVNIRILSSNGNVVSTSVIRMNNESIIDLSFLTSGIYYVQALYGYNSKIVKIVKM